MITFKMTNENRHQPTINCSRCNISRLIYAIAWMFMFYNILMKITVHCVSLDIVLIVCSIRINRKCLAIGLLIKQCQRYWYDSKSCILNLCVKFQICWKTVSVCWAMRWGGIKLKLFKIIEWISLKWYGVCSFLGVFNAFVSL